MGWNPFSVPIAVGRLLIRADASVAIGTGHVMRMIALAQAWQRRGGTVALAARDCPDSLADRLSHENIQLYRLPEFQIGSGEDARATQQLANELRAQGLVIDGYQFREDFQNHVRSTGYPLMVVDDYGHSDRYSCDLVLNQNLGAKSDVYAERGRTTQLLLGPRFALLRNEFLNSRNAEPPPRDAADHRLRLLVTLGGSDEDNITEAVLNAIATIRDIPLAVRVLVGTSNPHADRLHALAKQLPYVSIWQNISDMMPQYLWADGAIAAGGSTNWEMCFFGLPRILVVLAENQRNIAAALAEAGVAYNLGAAKNLTVDDWSVAIHRLMGEPPTRQAFSQRSRGLVDGWGAARVVDEILSVKHFNARSHNHGPALQLRPARLSDSLLLLEWRNDPLTRQSSLHQEFVSPSDHEQWMVATIEGTRRRLFMAESAGQAIGTVRLDFGETVEISWTIAPLARGSGWGQRLVQQVTEQADCDLIAVVRPENIASQKIALAAGFRLLPGSAELLTYRRSVTKESLK